jgi:hypothetical protein
MLVIKDPIVSLWKAGCSKMHNDNAVFNPAPEEALIPVSLMIYQNGFCALSDCTYMDNPMTPCWHPSGNTPFAGTPFLYRPWPESLTTRISYIRRPLRETNIPLPLSNKFNVPAKSLNEAVAKADVVHSDTTNDLRDL